MYGIRGIIVITLDLDILQILPSPFRLVNNELQGYFGHLFIKKLSMIVSQSMIDRKSHYLFTLLKHSLRDKTIFEEEED